MKLYLMVSNDEYELPMAVADSAAELSRITGWKLGTIKSFISHYRAGTIKKSRFHRVEVEEE